MFRPIGEMKIAFRTYTAANVLLFKVVIVCFIRKWHKLKKKRENIFGAEDLPGLKRDWL